MAKPKLPSACDYCTTEPGNRPLLNDGSHEHKCPTCGHEVFYNGRMDRYFHVNGTDNRRCWRGIDNWMVPE